MNVCIDIVLYEVIPLVQCSSGENINYLSHSYPIESFDTVIRVYHLRVAQMLFDIFRWWHF